MRIFLDTANVDEIRHGVRLGVVSGVTTNPTLLAKEGKGSSSFKAAVQEICSLVEGPVSAEVLSQDVEGMVREAREISSWAPNVIVKIPAVPEGLEAISTLAAQGVRCNCTLCFSVNQALLAALAGAAFVSPFVGRLDDEGHDGMALVADIVGVLESYKFSTQVIAASIRHPLHCVAAAQAGAHIATVPYKVLLQMVHHPLTDVGVARFRRDWERVRDS